MFFLYYNISKNSIVFIYVRKLQEKSLLITFDKTLKQNKMKKTLQFMMVICTMFIMSNQTVAQNTVTINGSATWNGYANVFQTNGTTWLFGQVWGVPALKSTVTTSSNTIKLQPNFNAYADAVSANDIAYWRNGTTGNKVFEGNTFIENNALAGQVLTFKGTVTENTITSAHSVVAFIKGLNAANGYSADVYITTPLTTTGDFSITTGTAIPSGLIVQYGFTVKGLNANPADETALGHVTVTAVSLANASFDATQVKLYPNPANDFITLENDTTIESIAMYNILGQEVLSKSANSNVVTLDINTLDAGMYVIKTISEGKTSTSKFVKK